MHIKIITSAIGALLATNVSAQTPVSESTERVVQLTNTPTTQGFQEIATALRAVAQIRNLTIDSEHNSFVLHGTVGDLAMAEWMIHMMDRPAGWRPSDQEIWNPATREYRAPASRDPVARVYYLTNTTSSQGLQEIITLLRTVADIQKIFSYTPARVVVFRGPAGDVDLAEWLIHKLDLPASAKAPVGAKGADALRQESAANLYRLPAPQRDGSEDLVRVFYLSPTMSPRGIQEMITAMRKSAGIQKVFSHTAPPAIAARGNPAQLAQAQRIIEGGETTAAAR
jgi:hypothetical protein